MNKKKVKIYYTPDNLVKKLINMVPIEPDDSVLDAFAGNKVFHFHYPPCEKYWCEIRYKKDFFDWNKKVSWIVTNPPFHILDKVLSHTIELCEKGFAYILNNLTVCRIKKMNDNDFWITRLCFFKVRRWKGNFCFVVFQKGIGYNIVDILPEKYVATKY